MALPNTFHANLQERVVQGVPAVAAVAGEVRLLGRQRVYLVANRSLAETQPLAAIAQALGPALAGRFTGIRAHTPREDVLAAASHARTVDADLVLGVGGGSVIDACKVLLLCLRHGLTQPAQLDPHAGRGWGDTTYRPADAAQWARIVAVPTTFSAAEYTAFGGATESATRRKQAFVHPMMVPQVVVLDPAMTLATPLRLLLATGMKAMDHAVERVVNPRANAYSDAVSLAALRLLARSLPRIAQDPADLEARADAQQGVFLSLRGASAGVGTGLSHAIAHALGSLAGVDHGDTSSLLLPATMRWLAPHCPERQRLLCEALGEPGIDASVPLERLVERLELPARLRETALREEMLPMVAERALQDPLLAGSPRVPAGASDILAVLAAAW